MDGHSVVVVGLLCRKPHLMMKLMHGMVGLLLLLLVRVVSDADVTLGDILGAVIVVVTIVSITHFVCAALVFADFIFLKSEEREEIAATRRLFNAR